MTDGGKGERAVTVGLDIGDRYSYLCMLDTESGEVIEEGRLRTLHRLWIYGEVYDPLYNARRAGERVT